MGDDKHYATQARIGLSPEISGPGAQATPQQIQGNPGVGAVAKSGGARRGGSLTHAATIRLGGRMAKIAASVIAFSLAARALSGNALGTYVVVFAFIQLFNTVANFGVDRILIRDLAQPERERGGHVAFTHASITSRLLITVGICGLTATAAVFVLNADQLTSALLFLPYILVTAFGTNGMYGSVLQARNDNNSIALASIVSAAVVILGTIAAITLHAGVDIFLFVYTLSSLADTIICAFTSRKFVPWGMSWSGPLTRYLLAESLPLAIGSTFVLIYGRIDIILLDKLIPPAQAPHQVALYGVAYKFYDVLSTVSATVMIVLFPGLARAYAASVSTARQLYTQVFTLMAVIGLPLAFSVLAFHPIMLSLIAGHGYAAAQSALPGLMLAIALIFPSTVASYMVIVVRRQRWNLPMAVIASVLNIGLNLVFIPRFGYVAAAWITAVTEGYVIVFNLSVVALTAKMLPSPRKVLLTLLAATPFALIFLPGKLSYAGSAVGIVLFAALLLLFGVVRPSQLRTLVSSRDAASPIADEIAEQEIEDVLPALAYVAQSDQPSMQLAAIRSGRSSRRTWETSMQLKAVHPEDLLEPPQDKKRRQVAALFGGIALLALISTLCIVFLHSGVEIATLLVFAAMLGVAAVRPQWALFIFVLALPLHNLLMALLFNATGDQTFIKLIQPWKEVVLAIALLRAGLPALLTWLRTRRVRLTALDVVVLLFMGFCLLSVALPSHVVPLVGRVLGFRQLALPFAVYFLGRLAPPSRREIRWLVGSFALITLAMALAALGERVIWGDGLFIAVNFGGYSATFFNAKFYLPHNMGYTFFTGTPGWLPRAGSLAMNPLDLATLLLIAIPIAMAAMPFFKKYWGWPGRIFLGATLILGGAALIMAFSRTNLLMLPVVALVVVLLVGIRRQWPALILVALGCAIGVSLYAQTTFYVLAGPNPSDRVARADQGLVGSGVYGVLDIVAPIITFIGIAIIVAALVTFVLAVVKRQRRSLARAGIAGALGIVLVAACLLTPTLGVANASSIFAPLTPYTTTVQIPGASLPTSNSNGASNGASSGGNGALGSAINADNTSTQGHVGSYKQMIPFMLHHPIGYGIGSAGFLGVRLGTGLGTESAYLPVGVQLGFPGLLLYLLVFLMTLYTLWNASRARLDRLTRAVFVGALAAWIFVMVDGVITEVTLNFFVLYIMLWLTGSAATLSRWSKVGWSDSTQRYQAARPLKIAMDVQCLYTARTGVRTYVTKLIEELQRSGMPHEVVTIAGPKGLPRTSAAFRMVDQVLTLTWLHILLPLRAALGGYDVLFSPEYLTPFWCPIPNVVTYHDSAFLRRPQDYNRLWQLMFRRVNLPAVRRAEAVVVPSRYTGDEAVRYAQFAPERIVVTPLGGPQPGSLHVSDAAASQTLARLGLTSGAYLLHVGVLERRKNLPMLVEALAQLRASGLADVFKLALIGQPGPRPDLNDLPNIQATVERLGLQQQVILTGHLSQADVDALLTHAGVYVFPSKSEGFGIPVLEAFAAGVPLVCSTAGALPEVAGDAALMFDPDNLAQLVECLRRLGGDRALRERLIAAGAARARQFTWKQTALLTMDAFEAAVVRGCAPTEPFLYPELGKDSSSVMHSGQSGAR